MKKLLFISVTNIAFLAWNSVNAADLGHRPVYPAAPPSVVAPILFTWTGCYIGANIGGAWAHKDFSSFENVDEGSHSATGIAGGGQIGCDYQFASNWLIGVRGLHPLAVF
jgi:outer membrane immunogenic protein